MAVQELTQIRGRGRGGVQDRSSGRWFVVLRYRNNHREAVRRG